jgi:hypothetical protein
MAESVGYTVLGCCCCVYMCDCVIGDVGESCILLDLYASKKLTHWNMVKQHVHLRAITLYWQEETQKKVCEPHGAFYNNNLKECKAVCAMIMQRQ